MHTNELQHRLINIAQVATRLRALLAPKERAGGAPLSAAEVEGFGGALVSNARALREDFEAVIGDLEALAESAAADVSGPEAA